MFYVFLQLGVKSHELFTSALFVAIVKPFGDLRAFVIGVVGESSMEWAQWKTEKGEVDILDTGRADLRSFTRKGRKMGMWLEKVS